MGIANHGLEGLARNGEILARTELGSQASLKDQLARNLSSDSGGQDHPGQAKSPAKEVQVPHSDDGGNNGSICDGRVTFGKQ